MGNCKAVESYNVKTKVVVYYDNIKQCAIVNGLNIRTLQNHLASNNSYRGLNRINGGVLFRYYTPEAWDKSKINTRKMFTIGERNLCTKILKETKDSKSEQDFESLRKACLSFNVPYKRAYYHLILRGVKQYVYFVNKSKPDQIKYTVTV